MLLDELYDHFGNWTRLVRTLNLGNSTYQIWRRQGFIPFKAQLFIEYQTKGLFKANEEHGETLRKQQ